MSKRRLRVLLVAYHFPPVSGSSGLHRTVSLCRLLRARGHDVEVLSVSQNCYSAVEEANLELLPSGVRIHRASAFDSVRTLSVFGMYPGILRIPDRYLSWVLTGTRCGRKLLSKGRFDWIYTTFPFASAHLIGSNLAASSQVPWIADFRDPMSHGDYPKGRLARKVMRWIERRVAQRSALMTFATEGSRQMYEQRYPEIKGRTRTINNGYDEALFTGVEPLEANQEERIIVHSGTLYLEERDPRDFFKALQKLKAPLLAKKYRIRLRASGHDRAVQALIDQYDLSPLVELAPLIGNREAVAEMLGASYLLLLQADKCNAQIPAKTYEYIRSGRPIIGLVAPEGETAAVLRTASCSWQAPLADPDAIARLLTIQLLESDPQPLSRPMEEAMIYEREQQFLPLVEWMEAEH